MSKINEYIQTDGKRIKDYTKEVNQTLKGFRSPKEKILSSIVEKLWNGQEKSIASLCRDLNMKRSTLIYYLTQLEIRGLIDKKRVKTKLTGRPTIIKLKKSALQKLQSSKQDRINCVNDMLEQIKSGGLINITTFDFDEINKKLMNKYDFRTVLMTSVDMQASNLVEHFLRISKEGETIIEENKKEKKR